MLRYKLSQSALAKVHVDAQKLKSAPWWPIDAHQWDSTVAMKAFSRIPTDDDDLAAEVVMVTFSTGLSQCHWCN